MTQTYYSTGFVGYGFRDNVNGLELTDPECKAFTADIVVALIELGAEILALTEGLGQWEGVVEPCGSITFRLPIDHLISVRKANLCEALAAAAATYDQDSVALTFGDTVLIGASCSV